MMFCLLKSVASSPRRYTYLGCHLASVILLNVLLFFFLSFDAPLLINLFSIVTLVFSALPPY